MPRAWTFTGVPTGRYQSTCHFAALPAHPLTATVRYPPLGSFAVPQPLPGRWVGRYPSTYLLRGGAIWQG